MSRLAFMNGNVLSQADIMAIYRGAQQIVKHVYLTSHEGANEDTIRRLGIKAVINCTTNLPHSNVAGVPYYRVPIEDSLVEKANSYFEPVAAIIEGYVLKGHPVLIHCQAGVSRSATCLLAYMISHHDFTLRDAFQQMKRRRHLIEPNPSFMEQLMRYETAFRPNVSVRVIYHNGLPLADVIKDDPYALDRAVLSSQEERAMRQPNSSKPFAVVHESSARSSTKQEKPKDALPAPQSAKSSQRSRNQREKDDIGLSCLTKSSRQNGSSAHVKL